MARNRYEGWVLALALFGSLFAVAAIAIAENFIPQATLVLTQGEYEILAAVFYVIAIVLYLFGGERRPFEGRGTGTVLFIPRRPARVTETDNRYAQDHPVEIEA